MAEGKDAGGQQITAVRMEVFRGAKAIAKFLGIDPATVRKQIRAGKLPVKKDLAGAWVLCNIDLKEAQDLK